MPICPHCKMEVNFDNIKIDKKGFGVLKQEIMYYCPHCQTILGVSRGKWTG